MQKEWQHNGAVYNLKSEDTRIVHEISPRHLLLGIADGHGGSGAALMCKQRLPAMIQECMQEGGMISDESTIRVFERLNALCCSALTCCSGAALTVCIVDRETGSFVCANVGDAECMLVTPTSHLWITTSHRLQDNSEERTRVRDHVHFVSQHGVPTGPPRLYPGGLSCSRSIGDSDCPHSSCHPSICHGALAANDVLLIASDGLWDVTQPKKLASIARETRCALSVLKHKRTFDDDTSLIVLSQLPARTPSSSRLFFRSGSGSSISSDDEPPFRTILGVQL